MSLAIDLSFYWVSVGAITISLSGFWAFRRLKSLFSGR